MTKCAARDSDAAHRSAGPAAFAAACAASCAKDAASRGEIAWQVPLGAYPELAALPAAGFATPAVYEADGKQFVVVAAGGGKLGRPSGDRYVAFALPGD